ncbi:MAG: hypothetical protein MUF81_20575, partial [Verrucomicrobia bacterium]|nr:hypothetical protein [Verrucomicrobiota bacterium]
MAHQRTLQWVTESAKAGKPWVVCNDEQNPASLGVPPDPGYQGHDGVARVSRNPETKAKKQGKKQDPSPDETPGYTLHDVRKLCLWGTLMAGGAGVEYYFGYQLPQNDLNCEDFHSRDKSWDYCRIALDFFPDNRIPFWDMTNANALIGNTKNDNSKFCFAKAGELYLVYLPVGGETPIDLAGASGKFSLKWFDPREGGALQASGNATLDGGSTATLTAPSADDWLAVIARE